MPLVQEWEMNLVEERVDVIEKKVDQIIETLNRLQLEPDKSKHVVVDNGEGA